MKISKNNISNIQKVISTSVIFYLAGWLALPLSIPPGNVGAIWPPAGIGIAATLLWGYRVLPGIFVAEIFVAVNIFGINDYATEESFYVILVPAFSNVLRSWLGCFLIKKSPGFPDPLISVRSIVIFFLLAGVVATLMPAFISVTSLLYAGYFDSAEYLSAFLIWWLGDCIGVIIFAPLFLIFFSFSDQRWMSRRLTVGIPLIVTFVISVLGFNYVQIQEKKRLKDMLYEQAKILAFALDNENNAHLEMLFSVESFLLADEGFTRKKFNLFARTILAIHSDLKALVWIVNTDIDNNNPHTGKVDDKKFSTKYALSHAGDTQVDDFNFLSKREHQWAMLSAWKNDTPYSSKPLPLMEGSVSTPLSYTMYLPVFSSFNSAKDRDRLIGFVSAVFNLNDYINAVVKKFEHQDIVIRIWDHTQEGNVSKLYQSDQGQSYSDPLNLRVSMVLELPGQRWMLEVLPTVEFLNNNYLRSVWYILAIGMLFTSLLSISLLLLTGQSEQVRLLANDRTKELKRQNRKLQESESQFRELVQAQAAIVWKADPKTLQFTFVSDEACSIVGYSPEQWVQERDFWFNHMHPEDREWVSTFSKTEIRNLRDHEFEFRMISFDHKVVWLHDYVNLIIEDGEVKEQVGFMIDVTARKHDHEQLRLAATTFESLEGIIITDKQAKILRVNKAFTVITGYSAEEVLGKNPSILKSDKQDAIFYRQLWLELREHGRFEGELWNKDKDGRVYPVWQTITAVKNEHGDITHYVAVFLDISEKKEAEERINKLAFYDPLTSLPNRRMLLERLNQELSVARRYEKFGAVIYLDLDHFKLLNDSLGHHIGDDLLQQVAQRLRSVLRKEDTPARLGGDEFVVLLHANSMHLSDAADHALVVAEKIKDALNKTYLLQDYEHIITPSIGLTVFPEKEDAPEAIIQQSDTAMYRSKSLGRNAISFFHPTMQEAADARLSLEKELRIALEQMHFVLNYQPQVDSTGMIVGVEALLRWQHPEKGIILPSEFIAVAEETNLIIPLGIWILKQACKQFKQWADQSINLAHISVNVSFRQFSQIDFVSQVQEAISYGNIFANQLIIELTEGVVIDNIDDTVNKMKALKQLGVLISIDDFGTGYSSLAYLKQLPLDQLKIDRSFIRDITTDVNDAIIIETIIDMAKNLGLNVIAEGVETKEQLSFLSEKGCAGFQGYYFGYPHSPEKFAKLYFKSEG